MEQSLAEPPNQEDTCNTGSKYYRCFAQCIISPVIGEDGCDHIGNRCLLHGLLYVSRRDVKTGRRVGISPIGHIHRSVYEKSSGKTDSDQGNQFQSLLLLVVLIIATIKKIVLTPAPTEASVKATSTDPISAQRRHIKKLYTPKMIAELRRSFTTMEAMAQIRTKRSRIRSSCQINSFPPCFRLPHDFPVLCPGWNFGVKGCPE